LLPNAYKLSCKCFRLARRLFGLGWVALCSFGRSDDVTSGLAVEGFEMGKVAIELPGVCADEGITLSHLAS
jgi:hypothetical protein